MIPGVCYPRPNGYMGQIDCGAHGTPWHEGDRRCDVTKESWAEYIAASRVPSTSEGEGA